MFSSVEGSAMASSLQMIFYAFISFIIEVHNLQDIMPLLLRPRKDASINCSRTTSLIIGFCQKLALLEGSFMHFPPTNSNFRPDFLYLRLKTSLASTRLSLLHWCTKTKNNFGLHPCSIHFLTLDFFGSAIQLKRLLERPEFIVLILHHMLGN